MSNSLTTSGKIEIAFYPIVIHPIPGIHPPNTKSRAGGYSTWVEVSSDFTLDRIHEIFDIKIPWANGEISEAKKVLPKFEPKKITVPSSDGRKEYLVVKYEDGSISCSCTGYGYHGHCKHQAMIDNPDLIPSTKKIVKIRIPIQNEKASNKAGGHRVKKIF